MTPLLGAGSIEYLFSPGDSLSDYVVKRPIAKGGVSEVYLVQEQEFGFTHALKVALPARFVGAEQGETATTIARSTTPVERTIREARMLATLNHPNIIKPVRVMRNLPHDCCGLLLEHMEDAITLDDFIQDLPPHRHWGEYSFRSYMDFDACIGQSAAAGFDPQRKLKALVDRYGPQIGLIDGYKGPLTPSDRYCAGAARVLQASRGGANQLIECFVGLFPSGAFLQRLNQLHAGVYYQLENAIEYLTGRKVVHKDIRGSNVLVDRLNTVKLIDFGMASPWGEGGLWASRTVRPPESYCEPGGSIVNETTDLWGLGVLIYQGAFGHHPLSNTNDKEEIVARTRELCGVGRQHCDVVMPLSPAKCKEYLIRGADMLLGHSCTWEPLSQQTLRSDGAVWREAISLLQTFCGKFGQNPGAREALLAEYELSMDALCGTKPHLLWTYSCDDYHTRRSPEMNHALRMLSYLNANPFTRDVYCRSNLEHHIGLDIVYLVDKTPYTLLFPNREYDWG